MRLATIDSELPIDNANTFPDLDVTVGVLGVSESRRDIWVACDSI